MHRPTTWPEVIAHRGASAYRAEHTFAAFDLALEQGADTLELDVRCSADGHLVVLHDATLLRLTGWPHRVDRLPLTTLRDAGALTLTDVLARYRHATRYLVELKDPVPAWEHGVVDTLGRSGLAGRATIQSFDVRALRRLHAAEPGMAYATLHRRAPSPRALASLAAFASGVGVWHRSVDAALVGVAHARGLAVRAWTVNGADEVRRMVALGVDGVITDAPDVVAAEVCRAPQAVAA